MTSKITLALLYGGTSPEREISLRSGEQAYAALDRKKYDILRYDPATDLAALTRDAEKIDAALVILHGIPGEDGTISGLLDLLHIPYQCSGPLGSAVAMNKVASKYLYEKAGITVPAYRAFRSEDPVDFKELMSQLGLPLVIKPASGGSSIGMTIAERAADLEKGFSDAFARDDMILAEEYVKGTEITGAVVGNQPVEALPIVEIVPTGKHVYFDFEAKYDGGTDEICPARIGPDLTRKAQELAIAAHGALFCEGYSRTDMIIKDNRIYVLETNTIPGMTTASLLPKAAREAGMSFSQLLDRLVALAMERRKP